MKVKKRIVNLERVGILKENKILSRMFCGKERYDEMVQGAPV